MRYFFLQTILKSARVVLWPAIFVNTFVMSTLVSSDLRSGAFLSLALCFAATFGFLINDLFDTAVDRINRSGRLESAPPDAIQAVQLAAVVSALMASVLAATISATALIFVVAIVLNLAAYTFVFRKRLFLANALAAILASSPVWMPFLVFHSVPASFQIAVIAVCLMVLLGREIAADAKDEIGDGVAGRKTLATVFGCAAAVRIAIVLELTGSVLLVCSTVLHTEPRSSLSLLLYALALIISLTLVRAALGLWPSQSNVPNLKAHGRFVAVTRLAMLLLPAVIFLGS